MKFRLGLFDRPYVDVPAEAALDGLAADEARAARVLAERSLVLVENDGILPLAASHRRVAVIGPIADSARDLLGDYSHLVHMETLREMRAGVDALGIVGDGDVIEPDDELSGRRTILDALRSALVGSEVATRTRHRDLGRDRRRSWRPPSSSPAPPTSRSSSSASAPG